MVGLKFGYSEEDEPVFGGGNILLNTKLKTEILRKMGEFENISGVVDSIKAVYTLKVGQRRSYSRSEGRNRHDHGEDRPSWTMIHPDCKSWEQFKSEHPDEVEKYKSDHGPCRCWCE